MRKALTAIFSILIILSCQKETDPDLLPDDCRLIRSVQGVNNGQGDDTTFLFNYDANDRLNRITWISEGFPMEFELKYDDQGHLIHVNNLTEPDFLETIFRYDNNGRLSEIHFDRFDSTKYIFEYVSGNQPARCRQFEIENGQWDEGFVTEYHYINGNVVREEVFIDGISKWNYEYDYDEKVPNAFTELALISINSIPFGYYSPIYYFNKNMVKTEYLTSGYEGSYTYKVDSGRVTQILGSLLLPPSTDTLQRLTRSFEYGCR
jgi:YD repeat-containing protein